MNLAPAGAPLLAADVGAVYTKAYLLSDVEGERRLIAVGRAPTCGDDGRPAVAAALTQAVTQALDYAGLSLGDTRPHPLLLTSLGAVARLALVANGLDDVRAIVSALQELPVRLLEPVLLEGPGGDPERLLAQVEAQAPDAVIVAGGARTPATTAAQTAVETLARASGPALPVVVLAGDSAFLAAAAPALAGMPHAMAGSDPAAVGEADGALRGTVARLVGERLGGHWFGRPALDAWLEEGAPGSSLQGVCTATEIIADRYDVDALTLDLGAAHAMAVAAIGAGGHRRVTAVARDDLGLRLGRRVVLREAGAEAVARWLPLDLDEQALRDDARKGAVAPAVLPDSVEALLLEHALAREALRLVAGELAQVFAKTGQVAAALPPFDLLIGSGGVLAGAPRLMQAALVLLDAVQPEALTQLALDRATALPLLGRLGMLEGAGAIGAALERDGLLNLGLCIAPVGSSKEGEPAIKVEVAYANRSPVTVEVPFGAIEVVPLAIGERASLKLWPARDFDIGLGRGNAATPRADVEGGAVGIVIDARGRPLGLPEMPEKRQAKLLQWLQATRAYPQLSFVQARPAASEG